MVPAHVRQALNPFFIEEGNEPGEVVGVGLLLQNVHETVEPQASWLAGAENVDAVEDRLRDSPDEFLFE
ncbi:MAG: hypothetical protein JRS35_27465 [Deltaproteobacteria bacterium]|nr:hypothetical protein [Deltaproteobacteria bacterium]